MRSAKTVVSKIYRSDSRYRKRIMLPQKKKEKKEKKQKNKRISSLICSSFQLEKKKKFCSFILISVRNWEDWSFFILLRKIWTIFFGRYVRRSDTQVRENKIKKNMNQNFDMQKKGLTKKLKMAIPSSY